MSCVALAPLPTGAVFPGGSFAIEAFAFLAAALAFAGSGSEFRLGAAALPAAGLLTIAALGCFQLIPFAATTLRAISPASAAIYDQANAVLHLYGRKVVSQRISIAPTDTEATIVLTLAYAALFSAAAILASSRTRRRVLALVLFGTVTIQVAVAALTRDSTQRLHGTFVNPNHMAGYLLIALSLAFGAIWAEVLTNADRGSRIRDRGERLEKRAVPFVWRILLWGIVATGIVLTRSRGGILAAILATTILVVMGILRQRSSSGRRRVTVAITAAVLAGVLFVAITAGHAPLLRFLSSDPRDIGTDTRVEIWRASVRAWHLFPNFGSGLGTFRETFRRVQPPAVVGLVEEAHNDFLQLLVTGGWIGAAAGVAVFACLFVLLFTAWIRQSHREESAFVLAAFGALLSLTLHGIVEFNMSIPAIPATLAVIAGAGWAAARDR